MINLRSLRYLVTLARRGSYARAAEDLGISQPALTRAVQAIERKFGVRLFDRDRTGVTLTQQGQAMLDGAAVLLANADDLERQWRSTAVGETGIVRFGMAPMPARAMLGSALKERLATAPAVRNDVVVRNVEALWPLLIAGSIEFFVAAEGQIPDAPPVRAESLGRFSMSLIVRPDHPLMKQRDDLCFPVAVSSHSGSVLPPDVQEYTQGLPHVVEDFDVLAQLTAATDVVWVSSELAVADDLAAGRLIELPRPDFVEPKEFRMMIYSLERRSLSPPATALAQLFRRKIVELRASRGP